MIGLGSTQRSRLLLAAIVASVALSCTRDSRPSGPEGRREIALWDFAAGTPPPALRLWPADPATPKRKKRALTTTNEEGRLAAVVTGGDPGFSWDFESPVTAAFLHVEVEATAKGPLQVYVATARCPIFSEPCSWILQIAPGKNIVNFLLDPALPLRALRLDLPEAPGARFSFDLMALRTGSATDTPFVTGGPQATLARTPQGLRLEATGPDPSIVAETPGLEASRVTAVELVLRGTAPLAPQLFWDGPCGSFSEECSAVLPRVDRKALTHRVVLGKHGKWSGRISALRLDPGAGAGEYVLERLSLVSDPAD